MGYKLALSWERPPPESYLNLGPGRTCSNIVLFLFFLPIISVSAGVSQVRPLKIILLCRSKYFAARQNFKGFVVELCSRTSFVKIEQSFDQVIPAVKFDN